MTGGRWTFTAECPECATRLVHVTASREVPVRQFESRAVARCPGCGDEYLLPLTLTSIREARKADRQIGRTIERAAVELAGVAG